MLIINEHIRIPLAEFQFDFVRSGGPGGQNVNKVNSKAVLKWPIGQSTQLPPAVKKRFQNRFQHRIGKDGVFTITSQRYRDQKRNMDDCLAKLRDLILAIALPPKARIATKPSRASKMRRLQKKQMQSSKKQLRQPPKMD